MNIISSVSVRAIPDTRTDVHPLMPIALFCTLVVGAALCVATYGLDLSAGYFNAPSRRVRIMAIR